MPSDDVIRRIMSEPELSDWLKGAMLSALDREPKKAAEDAKLLFQMLEYRANLLDAPSKAMDAILAAKNRLD